MRTVVITLVLFGSVIVPLPADAEKPAAAEFRWDIDQQHQYYTLFEGDLPVLRYNFGNVPMPEGRKPNRFDDGRPYGGPRSNYIHPLYGLAGEVITDDYPEHPHHRGVWWSWPVVRWGDRVADIWAVCDVWARPETIKVAEAGSGLAILKATNIWKFGPEQEHPIVQEAVEIRAYPMAKEKVCGRILDLNVTLTPLADGVAIGGRPKAGYGGMAYRAKPGANQEIAPFIADSSAERRAAWCRYTADFSNNGSRTSLVLFQHQNNPEYPSQHNVYANLNCFMPAFPGAREYPLTKKKPLALKHRIWIVEDVPSREALEQAWREYNEQSRTGR
jgi:Family of unknown function (DUF6807)